ncbi:YihY/virulence factor BrkB family protein [Sphingobium phenoxybenzoativorans]|uniref:YihY/virulence factor BrkB family protein n=1 Tax=Sphingobium phenoxybenzoativorans TaxID=1592790 RepID=A0A975K796_9SPHN|nr:YihY/virulence factor BrkB family protein [Sphingobium phenoxybenzoativorans]QUT04762.1 YihY/virulence factor BrkB family protein [Sphingobium phenoxybenzoativorans]
MRDISPQSPEARRLYRRDGRERAKYSPYRLRHGAYAIEVVKRVAVGVYTDGFIHAGNLAYLSLVALFPFFIVAAAIASIFGRTQDGIQAVNAFLFTVPPSVADVLRAPIEDVLSARSSSGLLWLGGLVGLWTTGSLIETIRDILRRAYGTKSGRAFWQYRLGSIGIIVVSVLAAMFAFSLQVMITAADEFLHRLLPFADDAINIVAATKLAPMAILAVALYFLFAALTPSAYRDPRFPKWPGAVLTTAWWYGTLLLLPVALGQLGGYALTYGSLAGVMIVLIFFFLVGLGVVIGAELNASLAEFPEEEHDAAAGIQEVKPE